MVARPTEAIPSSISEPMFDRCATRTSRLDVASRRSEAYTTRSSGELGGLTRRVPADPALRMVAPPRRVRGYGGRGHTLIRALMAVPTGRSTPPLEGKVINADSD